MDDLKNKLENGKEAPSDIDFASILKESLVGTYARKTQTSRDGTLVFTYSVRGLEDRHCIIDFFSLPTGKFIQRFTIATAELERMALSPNKRWLVVSSRGEAGNVIPSFQEPRKVQVFDRTSTQPEKPVLKFEVKVPFFDGGFFWASDIQFRDDNVFVATFGDKKIIEFTLKPSH